MDWLEYAQPDNEANYTLMDDEEPVRTINIPKPKPRQLKREKETN